MEALKSEVDAVLGRFRESVRSAHVTSEMTETHVVVRVRALLRGRTVGVMVMLASKLSTDSMGSVKVIPSGGQLVRAIPPEKQPKTGRAAPLSYEGVIHVSKLTAS